MRRVLSLWLPAFATERLRRTQAKAHAAQPDLAANPGAERPLVLINAEAGRQVLAAVDERAAALGLLPGEALAAARARVPDLLTQAYDPVGDAALLDRIVRWTLRYAPWAAPDPFAGGPGSAGLLIDITGASHLYGDEAALAEDLLARLSRFGHRGFIGLAGTCGGAWALARFAAPPEKKNLIVAPPERPLTELLDPLPPAALRLGASALTLLKRFGLETIGALRQVPAAALAPRFGEEVSRRLRQALGEVPEPISPQAPQESLQLRLLLADPSAAPVDRDRALAKLLSDLVPLLEKRGEGVRRLSFTAFRADGTFSEIGIGTSLATRDARHLERLFIAERDKLDPGFGFEAFLLSATRTEPMLAEQGLLPRLEDLKLAPPQETLAALIDRLENRLGEKSVSRPLPEARHRPERAFRLAGPFEKADGSWHPRPPRPLILLRRAEPVEAIALLPDQAPARFTWRRVPHRVIRAEGPERLLPDWWRPAEAASPPRDYFRVEDEAGRRFWLFRAKGASGERWFLQGLFA